MSLESRSFARPVGTATVRHGRVEVTFVQTSPADRLRPYVSGYQWVRLEGPSGEEVVDYAYPGWTYIRILTEGAPWSVDIGERRYRPADPHLVYGPLSRAARITRPTPGRSVTAGLTPLGWHQLFGADASEFADRVSPLSALFGARAEQVAANLASAARPDEAFDVFDALFGERLEASSAADETVRRMHALLMSDEVIEASDFADRLGLSTRQASRLSKRVFGFAPKLLLRRRRFLRTLVRLRDADDSRWSELLDESYHDQAQFIRDFHNFMGTTPSAFFSRPRPLMEASHRAREAVLGSGVGGLHEPA